MKKAFILLVLVFAAFALNAQEMKTLTWGGQERQYVQYVPATAAEEAPVLFMLHGMGDQALNFFHASGIQSVAEQKGWIVIAPQALDFTFEIPGVASQDFGTCWAAGVTIHVTINLYGFPFNYDITVNENVDDVGFLFAALDAVGEEHGVCADSLFFAGFSLGGFMSHRMAIEHGDKINGIASASGLVGNDMESFSPVANVNVLELYGTNDEMISYDSAMISYQSFGEFRLGLPAEETVGYWVRANQCNEEAVLEQYPDTHNDGLTFEMYSYLNGDNDSRVGFLKVNNGLHRWYANGFDINYCEEIVRFFTNSLDVTDLPEQTEENLTFYPNPAKDFIQVESEEEVDIYDLTGQMVLKGKGKTDVSSLACGLYFVKTGSVCKKLVINR